MPARYSHPGSPPNASDIGDPFCVGLLCRKVVVQHIGRNWLGMLAVGGADTARLSANAESDVAHQAHHPLAPTPDALLLQRGMHPWTSLYPTTFSENLVNVLAELLIGVLACAWLPLPPGVIAILCHIKNTAHDLHRKLLLVLSYEVVAHRGRCKKNGCRLFKDVALLLEGRIFPAQATHFLFQLGWVPFTRKGHCPLGTQFFAPPIQDAFRDPEFFGEHGPTFATRFEELHRLLLEFQGERSCWLSHD